MHIGGYLMPDPTDLTAEELAELQKREVANAMQAAEKALEFAKKFVPSQHWYGITKALVLIRALSIESETPEQAKPPFSREWDVRPYQRGEDMTGISVSAPDTAAGSPKLGDMIARNPKNHTEQWLVAAKYFADNFEPLP